MDTVVDSVWRRACAAALVELPGMSPVRLRSLLEDAPPETVWQRLAESKEGAEALPASFRGDRSALLRLWRPKVRRTDPQSVLDRYDAAGVGVWHAFEWLPERFEHDPWAPSVLFYCGNRRALDVPTVGIVGTRRCSAEGRINAHRFGAELSEAGVSVVSGLALGVDGAAHEGALSTRGATPVAVVGSGLDVVYPRRHRQLWSDVAERGLLLSEAQLGAAPEPWRFPARNRIIAALSDVLVVIESNEHGGSLLTVNEAAQRSVTVMAVPGSIRSKTSVGTNALLRDGAVPACGVQDVLDVLSLESIGSYHPPVLVAADDFPVLEAVDRLPTSTEQVVLRTGGRIDEVIASLLRLQQSGALTGIEGWWQRVDDETGNE